MGELVEEDRGRIGEGDEDWGAMKDVGKERSSISSITPMGHFIHYVTSNSKLFNNVCSVFFLCVY